MQDTQKNRHTHLVNPPRVFPSTASKSAESTFVEPSQATASKHWSPHSVRVRVRVRVRVVGREVEARTVKNTCNCRYVLVVRVRNNLGGSLACPQQGVQRKFRVRPIYSSALTVFLVLVERQLKRKQNMASARSNEHASTPTTANARHSLCVRTPPSRDHREGYGEPQHAGLGVEAGGVGSARASGSNSSPVCLDDSFGLGLALFLCSLGGTGAADGGSATIHSR